VSNTAKILKKGAGEEMRRVSKERGVRAAGAGQRKRIRRGEKEAETSSKRELSGGHGKGG